MIEAGAAEGGSPPVHTVVPSEARSRITIHLNKKVPASTKVAWIVFD